MGSKHPKRIPLSPHLPPTPPGPLWVLEVIAGKPPARPHAERSKRKGNTSSRAQKPTPFWAGEDAGDTSPYFLKQPSLSQSLSSRPSDIPRSTATPTHPQTAGSALPPSPGYPGAGGGGTALCHLTVCVPFLSIGCLPPECMGHMTETLSTGVLLLGHRAGTQWFCEVSDPSCLGILSPNGWRGWVGSAAPGGMVGAIHAYPQLLGEDEVTCKNPL